MERCTVRLLSTCYDLTNTGYKFLESMLVELRENRLGRSSRTVVVSRNVLYEQQWNIYTMLRNEYKYNFISIEPLMAKVCTLNDATLVCLDSSSVRMTMIEMILDRIFDGCIGVTFER